MANTCCNENEMASNFYDRKYIFSIDLQHYAHTHILLNIYECVFLLGYLIGLSYY